MVLLIALAPGFLTGQVSYTRYWNKWNKPDKQIDMILSKVPIESLDTIFCDDYILKNEYKKDWYVDFYNKQFGKFFSEAINVNFNMFWYVQKNDSIKREIHITQFTFDSSTIEKIKPKIQSIAQKNNNTFIIPALTYFKCVFHNQNVFFICTEPRFVNSETDMKFFDIVTKTFISFDN